MTAHRVPPKGRPDPEEFDYAVGYRKPPKSTQFKPGVSGNPKGAPKKVKSEREVLTRILAKKRVINTPEGAQEVEGMDLILTRMFKDTVEGKVGQTKNFLSRIDLHGIGRDDDTEDLAGRDAEVFDKFYALLKAKIGKNK